MRYRYAQIDEEGFVIGDSQLIGIVETPDMIPIQEDFDLINKKYINGEWIEFIPKENPEEIILEPTQVDRIEASLDFLVMISS